MSDSPQNSSYTVQNRPLGASERGRTRLGEKIETLGVLVRVPFSDPIFEGSFGGLLVLKMGHAAYLRKAHDFFFPTV